MTFTVKIGSKFKKMVTILLPVHNDEKYLGFTLESILSQEYKDYKCLIGFNGTKDKSKEISDRIIGKDNRFEVKDFGDLKGKSITLNKLLDLVETDRICLIDGDDMWHPEKLKSQIQISDRADVIGTLTSYIDEKNKEFLNLNLSENNEEIRDRFMKGDNQIVNSSSFFKTGDALEIGGWNSEVEGLEDFDFWIRLLGNGKTFFNIQKNLVYHRIHKKSNFNSKQLPYTVNDILNKNKTNANTVF